MSAPTLSEPIWFFIVGKKCRSGAGADILAMEAFHGKKLLKRVRELPQVMNIAKIGRAENLGTVPDSKFPEYSNCNHHFAIAPQKT